MEDQAAKIDAMTQARNLISKFKDKITTGTSWLVHQVQKICSSEEKPLAFHGYTFECSRKAAKTNHKILKKNIYNFESTIGKFPNSIISPGSEFRPIEKLKPLLESHEDWNLFKAIITEGADYPFTEDSLSEEDLRIETIEKGHHKSAEITEHKRILIDAYEQEVTRGWQIPVTVESLSKLKGAMMIPLGVAKQLAVNDKGEYVDKYRVTHDCSYEYSFGASLNSSVDFEALPDCKYGKALIRFLHQIHIARFLHPIKKIYMVKTDLDAAYRRVHVHPRIAIKQISIIDKIANIGSRLPFGSSPAPSLYCIVSDIVFDLANDLLEDPSWDFMSLHSPNKPKFPPPVDMDDSIEFQRAKKLLPPVPYRDIFIEGYVDDGIGACVDIPSLHTIEKLKRSPAGSAHYLSTKT